MKSIRYLLTGRPYSLTDCLDFAKQAPPPVEVALGLVVSEFPTDLTVLVELVAEYTWRFNGQSVACSEVCGVFSILDDDETVTRCLADANARLRHTLEHIEARNVTVVNGDQAFVKPQPALGIQGR